MKFSIKFLGIIALSDVTQAAFVPIRANTTDMAKASSDNTTGGPEFPVKVRCYLVWSLTHADPPEGGSPSPSSRPWV